VDVNFGDHSESYDCYITAQIILPKGGELKVGTVVCRSVEGNCAVVGPSNAYSMLDRRIYQE
jgi:hypothetical protein